MTAAASQPAAETPPSMLVVANRIDDLVSLDPAEVFELTGADLLANLYDTLVTLDPAEPSRIRPGLAEAWELGEDGVSYRFSLREGATFASGNPVTAEDAAFSLRRAVELQKTPAFILTQFGFTPENVEERIRAEGPRELTIVLDRAYAPSFFLSCLTAGVAAVLDRETVLAEASEGDLGSGWLRTNAAGSGPFTLRGWKPNESVVLEANPQHWRGAPAMRRVFIRHILESATQRLLLEKGDIDIARNLSPDDVAALEGSDEIAIQDDLKGQLVYLGFNQKHPALSNPKVAQALKHLIDYEGMAASFLRGQFVVHQAFLPSSFLGALDDKPFTLDPQKAKALLAEAGYPDGFEVEIDVRNVQDRLEMAQSLQASFAQAGVTLKVVPGTAKQVLTTYRARNHEIYLGNWGPDYPDPHSNADVFAHNPDNSEEAALTGKLTWRNAWPAEAVTKLTEAAVVERDEARRAALYEEIQRKVRDEGPFAVLFQQIEQSALRAGVEGFSTGGPAGHVDYRTVTK